MAFSDLYGSNAVRGVVRLATVSALGLSMAACVGSDDSYFDDGSAAQLQAEQQPIFHRLLSGTIIDPPKAQIEYTARAPLVPPPSETDLPAPQTAATSAKANVAWPKDPDDSAAAAALARTKVNPGEATRDRNRPGERLTPEEVQDGRIAGGGLNSASYRTVNSKSTNSLADRLTPEQMQQKPSLPTNDKTEISATPTRKYLIEPPSEYRTPATTAEMPAVDNASRDAPSSEYDPKKSKLDNLVGNN